MSHLCKDFDSLYTKNADYTTARDYYRSTSSINNTGSSLDLDSGRKEDATTGPATATSGGYYFKSSSTSIQNHGRLLSPSRQSTHKCTQTGGDLDIGLDGDATNECDLNYRSTSHSTYKNSSQSLIHSHNSPRRRRRRCRHGRRGPFVANKKKSSFLSSYARVRKLNAKNRLSSV
jgi:hypothetical protein